MSWHVMASVNSYVWGAGGLFSIALVTSMLWYMFWLVMAPVKNDIIDLVNWSVYRLVSQATPSSHRVGVVCETMVL